MAVSTVQTVTLLIVGLLGLNVDEKYAPSMEEWTYVSL